MVLTALRSNARYNGIFAMVLSNHDSPTLKEMAFRQQAMGWMVKSTMSPKAVARRLRITLAQRVPAKTIA